MKQKEDTEYTDPVKMQTEKKTEVKKERKDEND
jgi:hypothetical protein